MTGDLALRRATEADRPAIIDLCRASLGWVDGDPNEAFFAWKHDESPFGPSPSWVAQDDDGQLVGLRVFLRWNFRDPAGRVLRAVRAVDTATHPAWQGKGIFTKLTLGAIPELREDGLDLIFNTPNDKSRPGYLKMGWSSVGRVPVTVKVRSVGSLHTLLKARTAAEMWSEPTTIGESVEQVLADGPAIDRLLAMCEPDGIRTDRSVEYLRWRYRFGPLRYRAVRVGTSIEDGLIILRLRRRGPAVECAVCDVLVPSGTPLRRAFSTIVTESGADYLLRCAGLEASRDGFVPVPSLGPILTWRPLCRTGAPSMGDLDLALGDVELF